MVEHRLAKARVGGSNPLSRSILMKLASDKIKIMKAKGTDRIKKVLLNAVKDVALAKAEWLIKGKAKKAHKKVARAA